MDATALNNTKAVDTDTAKLIARTSRNAVFLAVSFSAQIASQMLVLSIMGRLAGVEKAGIWLYIVAFADPFQVIMDFGTTRLLVPEIARRREESDALLGNALTLGMLAGIPTLVALALIANLDLLHHPPTTIHGLYLAGLAMMLSNAALSIRSAFRALNRFDLEALNSILVALALVGGAFVVLALQLPFLWLFAVFILAHLLGLINSWWLYNRHLGQVKAQCNPLIFRQILGKSWIFILTTLLFRAYMRVDILILTYFHGPVTAGYYGLVTALFYRLDIITRLLTTSILPSMSRSYVKQRGTVGKYLSLAIKVQILVGLPTAVGGIILAPQIIGLLYGKGYGASAFIFQLLISVVLLRFINLALRETLTAMDLQHRELAALGFAAIFNVVVNFLLIPHWSAIGATFASMLSEIILFPILCLFLTANVRQNIQWNTLVRPSLSTLVMVPVLYLVRSWPLPICLVVGIVVYILALFLFRALSATEIQALVSVMNSIPVVPAPLQRRLAALMLSRARS